MQSSMRQLTGHSPSLAPAHARSATGTDRSRPLAAARAESDRSTRSRSVLRVVTALAGLCGLAGAQGTFTNFETPQTHPIEVALIGGPGGVEHVLVCNTPDNSLEVWTATSPPQFKARVSVGMGPGTVR